MKISLVVLLLLLSLLLFGCGSGVAQPPTQAQLQGNEAKLVIEEIFSDNFKCSVLKWNNTGYIVDARCFPKE